MTSWNLGGEGGNTFPFDNIGDYVQGTVLDLAEVQQTDLQSGQPAFWDDGKPKMMYRVTLQTELRDPANPADDGKRTVYLRGAKKPKDDGGKSSLCAVLDAVKDATGSGNLAYGGKLTLQYAANGPQPNRGFNAPKYYLAWYEPPQMTLEQPAEHKSAPPPPATPAFGSPADQQGPPPAWAQPAGQAPPAPAAPPAAPPAGPPAPAGAPPGAQAPAAPPAQGPWATQPPAGPPAPPPAAPQIPQQAPAAPPAAAPQQPAGPTPGAPAAGQPTQEQIAGLQALGIDPATVYPGWTPQPVG